MTQSTPDFYNDTWEKWELIKEAAPTARHTRRLIQSLLRTVQFESVLDVGCGDGLVLSQLRKDYPGVRLAGTEFSSVAVEMTKSRNPGVEIFQLDLSLGFLDDPFDLVLCIDVLEHIPDDLTALKHLQRMTSKYLLLAVPLGPLFPQEKILLGHVHGYSRQEVDQKIGDAGFRIVQKIQWGTPFYNIVRRLTQKSDPGGTSKPMTAMKRFLFGFLYYLYFLNLPFAGERYFVLASPITK